MKKLILALFITVVLSTGLFAQADSLFQEYRENPNTDNFLAAYEHYNKLIRNETIDENSRLTLSYLLLIELSNSLEYFQNNTDSLSTRTKFQYANLLLELGNFEEAIAIYEILNDSAPKWSCPWRHKGEAYFKSGKLTEAEIALNKSIKARKEHYDAYIMLADVQNEMGKPEEALETYETGLSYKGKDIEDPNEEVSDLDAGFLYLELLKENNKTEAYQIQKNKLKNISADDERWDQFE